MPYNTKKYNIDLVNNISGWCYSDTIRLHCAFWSTEQIEKYLNELSTTTNIPRKSCFCDLYAHFNACHDTKVMMRSISPTAIEDISNGELNINIIFKNWHNCLRKDCFENIKSGKCTDKFVIDIIGKKFFPNEYSK